MGLSLAASSSAAFEDAMLPVLSASRTFVAAGQQPVHAQRPRNTVLENGAAGSKPASSDSWHTICTASAAAACAAACVTKKRRFIGSCAATQKCKKSRHPQVSCSAVILEPGEKVIGIDLGTTNSVVATMEAGVPKVLPNAEGANATPSVVAYTKDGELLVGETAKRQAAINPRNTFHSIKRFVGRHFEEIAEEVTSFPYQVYEADGKVQVECPVLDKLLAPEEISAHVLRKLRQDAASFLNTKVDKAVISVPAYFNDSQRQSTKDAARISGLEVMRIVNEPTMAALAYGLDQVNNANIMVIDFGGGTFDISLLEVGGCVVEVLATSGDCHLGGNDFDQRILEWIAKDFQTKEGIDLREDRMALQRLIEASERAKMELSSLSEARISIPFVARGEDGPLHVDLTLTRPAFEELTKDLIQRISAPINQALEDACLRPKSISEVVLVGGTCRIPAVQQYVNELTMYKPVNSVINPQEAVAVGAAVQAAMIAGEVQDIMLIDVTPLTLGVETNGGVFFPVVERNTALPTKATKLFTTSADAQDEIEVVVLQGERPLAKDNKKLGTFRLDGIPPAPAGIAKIELTFEIDIDGVLTVTAKDWATRQRQHITIDGASTLEDWEVERIRAEAEASWADDEEAKERLQLNYAAECLVQQTEDNLADLGDRVPEDVRIAVVSRLDGLRDAIADPDNIDYIGLGERVKDMRFELMRLGQRVFGKQIAPDNRPGPAKPRPPGGVAGGGSASWPQDEEAMGEEEVEQEMEEVI